MIRSRRSRKRGPYAPRYLMRDTILEAVRRGSTRLRYPGGCYRTWSHNAHQLGLELDPVTLIWSPSAITYLALEDYIVRRRAGDSPLAINDVFPIHQLTDAR